MSLQQQVFDSTGLGVEVRQSDFRKYRKVLSKSTKDQLVSDAVAHFIQPHPTLSETFGETMLALTGRGLHVG